MSKKDPIYFLAADVGTSRMKVSLTDEDGVALATVGKPLQVQIPYEGACEMDMQQVWREFCAICCEIRAKFPEAWAGLAIVGITGQGDGLWMVDSAGEPCHKAVLWNDTRSTHLLNGDLDALCVDNNANLPFAGSFHSILRWIKRNAPDVYDRGATVFHCKDWINYRLTGNASCDLSDASLAAFDLLHLRHVSGIMDAFGIGGYRDKLPDPVSSDTIIGEVSARAAGDTGLPAGLPVIAGAIDVCAVARGTETDDPGDACVIIGTTLCSEVVIEPPQIDPSSGMVACNCFPGSYLKVMPTLSGTASLDWVRNILYPGQNFQQIENDLQQVPVGSRGVFYQPYLFGERAPFRNPLARGGFAGISPIHDRRDLMRAAYESIGLSIRDCFAVLPSIGRRVVVCGGGAQSDFLCQIIADCLGREILRSRQSELGIAGIVRLLRSAAGVDAGPGRREREMTSFRDRPEYKERYDTMYSLFYKLRTGAAPFWSSRVEYA